MKRLFKLYLVLSAVVISTHGKAQDTGIIFRTNLSWAEIISEAKAESKLIFIDCYASWCGPCKMMDQEIYTQKEVGDYFNSHFINVKMQMDRTANDNQQTRDFYPIADSISKGFGVDAFPTFLFFSPNGTPLQKFTGASETGKEFIGRAVGALDPNQQYFMLLSLLAYHNGDSAFILNCITAAQNAGDNRNARFLANEYIGVLRQPITKSTIELVNPYILSESDQGFDWFVHNADEINRVWGEKGFVEEILSAVIFKEEIAPILLMKGTIVRWKDIETTFGTKYPGLDKTKFSTQLEAYFNGGLSKEIAKEISDRKISDKEWRALSRKWAERFPDHDMGLILLNMRMKYYDSQKSWEQCGKIAIALIDRYKNRLGPKTINDIIWFNIFLHTTNISTLKKALQEMKNIVSLTPENTSHLDTYANLLYKTGDKREAMDWESKAINITKRNNLYSQDLEATLKKMQNGNATWESPGFELK